nr:MAG TPA: hypothetical protein [Caudoviricetes sp.]
MPLQSSITVKFSNELFFSVFKFFTYRDCTIFLFRSLLFSFLFHFYKISTSTYFTFYIAL